MNRVELELAIITAAQAIGHDQVLVMGSQAILGSFDEYQLPERATASQEVDIAPLEDDDRESLATKIDAAAGEWSPFDQSHGFYIQGVSVRTAYLPEGWATRVIEVRPHAHPGIGGLCLEAHDLCAAKMARNDQKDREFVAALVAAEIISTEKLLSRIRMIVDPRFTPHSQRAALSFVRSLR